MAHISATRYPIHFMHAWPLYNTLPSGTMHQCLHTWRERETFLRNGWQLATYGMKRSNIGLIDEKN